MTTQERDGLRAIRRNRFWFRFSLIGGLVAVWLVDRAAESPILISSLVMGWLVAVAMLLRRAVTSRCPRCGGYFFAKGAMPIPAKLLARECVRCGLQLRADRVIYPSME